MSDAISAGIVVHRRRPGGPELLLVHPGGPFWRNRDTAGWSIPKGLVEDGEDLLAAALREFAEETGFRLDGPGIALPPCRTPGRKVIHAWLVEADLDVTVVRSNTFELEWPPRSGKRVAFPEVDRAAYFQPEVALVKVHAGQRPLLVDAIARIG